MDKRAISKILGLFMLIFSISMLPPIAISFIFTDHHSHCFIDAFIVLLFLGLLLFVPQRYVKATIKTHDAFMIVALLWVLFGLMGALPFLISKNPSFSLADAIFETISGLTTTGSTVFSHLESLPPSILYYRQQLQFIGGLGIIVFAIAVLPMLGVGGLQLFRAEMTALAKDTKITPRVTDAAKALWMIYVGLTTACGLLYFLNGMSWFDAICHAFATISTGGFSNYDENFAHFSAPGLKLVASIFMVLGATSFSLHFSFFKTRHFHTYWGDDEFKSWCKIFLLSCLVAVALLFFDREFESFHALYEMLINSVFQIIAFSSTTGFVVDKHYAIWPGILPVLLMVLGIVGGCTGSTSGGIKTMRALLLHEQGMREIHRLIHPRAHFIIKYNQHAVQPSVLEAITGFFSVYISTYLVGVLIIMQTQVDFVTAATSVASVLTGVGAGFGKTAQNYSGLNDFSKWVLSFVMILGRLEVFTILVIFSRYFWKK